MGCLSVRRLVADSLLLCWLAQPVVFFFGVDHFWIVPLFLTILSCCRSNNRCYIGIGDMRDGVGIHPVSLEDPIVATYLILCYCNRSRGGMLDEKKFVRKNLQLPVTDVVKDRAVAIDLSFGGSAVGCARSPHTPLDVDRCSRIPTDVATPTC